MTKPKEIHTQMVEYSDFTDLDFKAPSGCKWYIKIATGDYLFIKLNKHKRQEAQNYVDNSFGKGKYRVRPYG